MIEEYNVIGPVAIITDCHTETENVKVISQEYAEVFCLGDFVCVKHPLGLANEQAATFFRKSRIPSLRGNHEQGILKSYYQNVGRLIYPISRRNRKYLESLPLGFKLNFPNGKNVFCFHNTPYDIGGSGSSPRTAMELLTDYPIDFDTAAVITGHNHSAITYGYMGLDCQFIRSGAMKNGEYVVIDENGNVEHRNLHYPNTDFSSYYLLDAKRNFPEPNDIKTVSVEEEEYWFDRV